MRFIDLLLATLLLPPNAHAISCDLAHLLNDPAIRNSAKFWEEFGAAGEMSDDAFRRLLAKYNVQGAERRTVERAAHAPAPVPSGSPRYTMSHQAVKETRALGSNRPALRRNLDEFLGYASQGAGYLRQQLMQNGGKWNYKKLEGLYGGEVAYSARLDGGVRVIFHQKENGLVEVIGVNSATTHR